MKANATMRTLGAIELDQVGGGFHSPITGGPVIPEPPIPPLHPIKPGGPIIGPVPYPGPIGPFPIH
jgi:hypothetical protein